MDCFLQDVIAVIPPYPYYVGDRQGFDVLHEVRDPDWCWAKIKYSVHYSYTSAIVVYH